MNELLQELSDTLKRTKSEASKTIIGQEDVIEKCLVVIFTGHHALLEGVPGIAKTLLVRTFGRILGAPFNRIQFTPDLMPSDITGTNIYDLQQNCFHLHTGPVFTSFLLADEINRAPAKTQSALLQAMQERRVTIDRDTHQLSPDFTVFATQNPVEYEGTYPLPEAQKDRFMMKISMLPPSREDELTLARRSLGQESPQAVLERGDVQAVLNPGDIVRLRLGLDQVTLRDELLNYVVDLVRRSREEPGILVGAGPRATQSLLLAGRCYAAISGRDFVTPDDIRAMADPVLCHRIVLRPEFEIEGLTATEAVRKLIQSVPVPR